MAKYCRLVALRLGLPPGQATLIGTASLLHDVGKLALPRRLVLKPGPLTPEERRQMQEHPALGHRILAGSTSARIETAATMALTHHERYDGRGYPGGLRGEEIPLEGRIAAACDVFDALTSPRPYRPRPFGREEALRVLETGRGTAFDPAVVDALVDSLDEIERLGAYRPRKGAAALAAA